MLPILFSVGPIRIYTLGFLLGIGFFLAAFISWRRLKELGLKEEKVIDLIILFGLSGLFFSRLFFILENFELFGFSLSRWIFLARYPGLSWAGGLVGIFGAFWWFTKSQKWDFWRLADELTFGILPLLVLAQLGYFLDGSSQGKPTSMPWGIFFPGSFLRQHPVSLFSCIFLLIIWIFLLRVERQWRVWSWYKSKASGFISLIFFALLFLSNFVVAFFKDSKIYLYWLEIVLSFLGFVSAAIIFYFRSGRGIKIHGGSHS